MRRTSVRRRSRRVAQLELYLADHALGVAVDQPAHAAAQLRELVLDRLQLGPARPSAHGLQAALVFPHDAGWILEQSADLVPNRHVQRLDREEPGLTAALAVEAVAFRPGAAIVAVSLPRRTRVCEAAHRLGEHAGELMPGQPWGDIRGMGNRLRHAYDRISLDVIWNAVRHDMPGLMEDARRALAQLRAEQDDIG